MFIKGEHGRQFAYEAHTVCDKNGMVLDVVVTAGNVHDSVAWERVYDRLPHRLKESNAFVMDEDYTTPWIAKKILDDGRVTVLPYTRYKGDKEAYRLWIYEYDPIADELICSHSLYTLRGLARVTAVARLKFDAMNLENGNMKLE